MQDIINSDEETMKRVYTFPTSQIKLNGKKSSYYEVINSLLFPECNKALVAIYNRIDINEICALIDETEYITDVQKIFYKHMIKARYEHIIRRTYKSM